MRGRLGALLFSLQPSLVTRVPSAILPHPCAPDEEHLLASWRRGVGRTAGYTRNNREIGRRERHRVKAQCGEPCGDSSGS